MKRQSNGRDRSSDANGFRKYPNGDVWCQARQTRIDMTVCVVQGHREPAKCAGCPLNL